MKPTNHADSNIDTQCIHAGLEPDPIYGSAALPIFQTSTFVFRTPEEGAAVEGGSCVVSGRTEPGNKVFVNEAPAAVSEKGEFSATAALSEGQYLVWVLARGPGGAETTVVREVSQAGAAAGR